MVDEHESDAHESDAHESDAQESNKTNNSFVKLKPFK